MGLVGRGQGMPHKLPIRASCTSFAEQSFEWAGHHPPMALATAQLHQKLVVLTYGEGAQAVRLPGTVSKHKTFCQAAAP